MERADPGGTAILILLGFLNKKARPPFPILILLGFLNISSCKAAFSRVGAWDAPARRLNEK